jgi:hypothetical protein
MKRLKLFGSIAVMSIGLTAYAGWTPGNYFGGPAQQGVSYIPIVTNLTLQTPQTNALGVITNYTYSGVTNTSTNVAGMTTPAGLPSIYGRAATIIIQYYGTNTAASQPFTNSFNLWTPDNKVTTTLPIVISGTCNGTNIVTAATRIDYTNFNGFTGISLDFVNTGPSNTIVILGGEVLWDSGN